MGGRERPLGLFEVLTRNRQSAVERGRRTSSALLQTLRMFTIPPRQQLPSPRRLVVRRWRVARGRIRIRIRIIAQVLKLPATLYNKERKERHKPHYFKFFSLFSSSLNKNFALKLLLQNNFRPKTRRERFWCLSSLLKSRLSLPPPPLSPPFLLFSSLLLVSNGRILKNVLLWLRRR